LYILPLTLEKYTNIIAFFSTFVNISKLLEIEFYSGVTNSRICPLLLEKEKFIICS